VKTSSLRSSARLAGAAGALGLGAAALRGVFLGYPAARLAGRPFLSRKEQAIVASLADAFFPPGGPIPIAGTEAGLVEYMDGYCKQLPAGQGRLVRLLLVFLEHAPWVFGPRRERFSSLPLTDRLRVLEHMRTSPIYFRRVAFLSIRTMLTMGYFANDQVARHVGSAPDPDPYGLRARRMAS
jgi:hypothetical protein